MSLHLRPGRDVAAPVPPPFRPSLELTFRGHRRAVLSAAFQPLTAALPPAHTLSAGSDGTVFLWSAKPTVRALRFTGHRGPVHDCAWSPHAPLVASAGHDGFVRLWLPLRRQASACVSAVPSKAFVGADNCSLWRAHTGPVRAVAFSPQEDWLFTAGDDKSVKCWDLNYAVSPSSVSARAVGGNGNKFVCGFTGGHQNWIRAVAVSSGAAATGPIASRVSLVASGGDDRVVQVWDNRSRRPTHTFYEHTGAVHSLDFHPDGCSLATGSSDKTINIFDLRRNRLLQHYDAHAATVHEVRFAPTGSWLLSAGGDGAVKLWDLKEGYLYCTLNAHEGAVYTARFSDTGAHFTTAGQDGIVMVWRSGIPCHISPPQQQQQLQQQEQEVVRGNAHSDRHMQAHSHKTPQYAQRGLDRMERGAMWNQMPPPPVPAQPAFTPQSSETETNAFYDAENVQDSCCSIDTSGIKDKSHVLKKSKPKSNVPLDSCFFLSDTLRKEEDGEEEEADKDDKVQQQQQQQQQSQTFVSPLLEKPPLASSPKRRTAGGSSAVHSVKPRGAKEAMDVEKQGNHECDNERNRHRISYARGSEKNNHDEHNGRVLSGTFERMEDEWRYPLSKTTHLTSENELSLGNKKEGEHVVPVGEKNNHRDAFVDNHKDEIDEDEISVVEYIAGSAYDAKGNAYVLVSSEKSANFRAPHGELDDRMQRLEEAYGQLSMETYKSMERSAAAVREMREQWDTQQRQQRGEMDQLRQMMEKLVEQQTALMRAVMHQVKS